MPKILISSYNDSKIIEFRNALDGHFETVTAKELNLPDVDETGQTFEENALLKARAGVEQTGFATLADDSGLELPVLDNFPGVITARFAKSCGTYEQATQELFNRVGQNAIETPAQYRCVLALVYPDGREIVTQGIVKGKLIWPKQADSAFGFDPWFIAEGEDRVFAAMSLEEKRTLSHRGRALDDLLNKIKGMHELRAVS